MKTVLFFRDFRRFSGGHLVVWHYFKHVTASTSYRPRVSLTRTSVTEHNPWASLPSEFVAGPGEIEGDVLFLAGLDWHRLPPERRRNPRAPTINLIQHLRHADPGSARYQLLGHPAIRICVSNEVAEAIAATGTVNGPILTITPGVDVDREPRTERPIDVFVGALKAPELGRRIAARLETPGRTVELVDRFTARRRFLGLVARSKVAVLLPHRTEGFFLPAIEAMALETILVCPDCVANRSFCIDGANCFRPAYDLGEIVAAAETASRSVDDLQPMIAAGRRTAATHSLAAQRAAFLDLLDRIDEVWEERTAA